MDYDSKKQDLETQLQILVADSKAGNAAAFGKLYDIFVDRIYRYIYYRIGKNEAEDLTELVFLKTWENIRQYRSGTSTFSSWIFRIAHNIVVDHYRATHSDYELNEQVADKRPSYQPQERIHRRLNQELLTEAMEQLKDHYRQILVLKYINDLSNQEIEYITGKSQAALRILQFRALKTLRKILEEKGISEYEE